ncbi:Peptidyl-prolyl cis-trans isomerase cyp8 [Tulasnella sp. 424]|nr:Peptidyl-prolyl cis-trans isomerase cyp8 [Tulasnella sp. 424]
MDLINEARAASSPSIAAEGFQQQPRTVRGRSYVGSSYGWDPRSKKKELFHAESRFILVHQTEAPGLVIAYTMFRFDDEETMEDGVMEPVVYCYEIQIAEEARRSGIGTVLMSDLEAIARKWKMKKVMLTALRSNVDAISFYEKLGFEMDPISPTKVIESRQTQDSAPNNAEIADKEDGWETESEDSFSQVDYEIYSKIVLRGHGANDKLYITHAEHSGALGQHSSSSGYKGKAEEIPAYRTPFDCCALSLQPFQHPVCAINEDGTGTVYDLLNIVPWLKEHDNTDPKGNPLKPSDLITLHYHRNSTNQLHDPVSFKPFSEHSHIVAIKTTGNVFLADSVGKLAGGRDLVSDVAFTKADIITLQNPHAAPTPAPPVPRTTATTQAAEASSSKASTSSSSDATKKQSTTEPPASSALAKARKAAAQPYNASPYSTGAAGASLTSTSLDPLTKGEMALYDEEELMFEDISRERKEKDRIKRRAYVRMVTNLGGSLNLELFCDKAPKTCYNFLMLAREGKYNDCPFHRLIPGFMIQGGDPTGTGRGGQSYWGTPFRDEYDLKGAEKHSERGVLSMANKGAATNGSQFFISFRATPHLDGKHTVFGKLVGGEEILAAIEATPVQPGTDKPAKPIKITEVIMQVKSISRADLRRALRGLRISLCRYQDPFEEYKKRVANKIQKQAESLSGSKSGATGEKAKDNLNWFGEKIGTSSKAGPASVGVGKYLKGGGPPAAASSVIGKRTTAAVADMGVGIDDKKKKRKMGFGDFDSW